MNSPHLLHLLLHRLMAPQHFLDVMELRLQPLDLWWEMLVRSLPQSWAGNGGLNAGLPHTLCESCWLSSTFSRSSSCSLPICNKSKALLWGKSQGGGDPIHGVLAGWDMTAAPPPQPHLLLLQHSLLHIDSVLLGSLFPHLLPQHLGLRLCVLQRALQVENLFLQALWGKGGVERGVLQPAPPGRAARHSPHHTP